MMDAYRPLIVSFFAITLNFTTGEIGWSSSTASASDISGGLDNLLLANGTDNFLLASSSEDVLLLQ